MIMELIGWMVFFGHIRRRSGKTEFSEWCLLRERVFPFDFCVSLLMLNVDELNQGCVGNFIGNGAFWNDRTCNSRSR